MPRSVERWSLALFFVAVTACSGDASAASTPNLTAHFEPPRSLGTPLNEVKRVSKENPSQEKAASRAEGR
jgi:hypothetical protein